MKMKTVYKDPSDFAIRMWAGFCLHNDVLKTNNTFSLTIMRIASENKS
jgi:hypothetical protein